MTTGFVQDINKYQQVAGHKVVAAVASAAKKTGVDFSFLMQKAATESSFNPTAKAKTSSATGLYQFVDQTWLTMIKKYGDKHGLGAQAAQIDMTNGKAVVKDPMARQQILALRKDPSISALMAAEFTAENKAYLECSTNCDVGSTELYLAHFMGAGGAAKFLNSRDVNGGASAAALFPAAAKANRSVFYDQASGKARSLNEVYDLFASKFSAQNSDGAFSSPSRQPHTPQPLSLPSAASATDIASLTPSQVAAQTLSLSMQDHATLPVFDDTNEADDIIWHDDPRFFTSSTPKHKLSSALLMAMTEMQGALGDAKESRRYNS